MELPPRLWKKDTHTYTVTANLPPQKEGPQLIIMIIYKRENEAKKARVRTIDPANIVIPKIVQKFPFSGKSPTYFTLV